MSYTVVYDAKSFKHQHYSTKTGVTNGFDNISYDNPVGVRLDPFAYNQNSLTQVQGKKTLAVLTSWINNFNAHSHLDSQKH